MQNRWVVRIFRVATALTLSPVLFAQTPTRPEAARSTVAQGGEQGRTAKSPPDLSGMWELPRGGLLNRRFSAEDAPLQPWALEAFKVNRGGITDPRGGVEGLDPEMYCIPSGMPRAYTSPPGLFELVQVPGRIYMLFQSGLHPLPRYIWTDGRGHPEDYPTTIMGHSIGRWDGDTLVVDTIAIDELTWLDGIGTPHSDALHVVERLRRVAQNRLEIDFRFEDPKAFTRPWTGKKVYTLNPNWMHVPQFACEERFRVEFEKKILRDADVDVRFGVPK